MVGRKRKGFSRKKNSSDEEQGGCPCGSKGSRYWICCDGCEVWYHGKCAKLSEKETNAIDKFYCEVCRRKNPSYTITYKPGKDPKRLKLDTSDPDPEPEYTTNQHTFKEDQKRIVKIEPESSRYEEQRPVGLPIFIPKDVERCMNCCGCFRSLDCGMCVNCHEKRGICIKKICNRALDIKQRDQRDVENESAELEKAVDKYTKKEAFTFGKKPVVPRLRNDTEVIQCHGPQCTKPSRPGSNYCSHYCGLQQARRRLLMVLPVRARDYANPTPQNIIQYKQVIDETVAKFTEYRRNLEYLASVKNFFVNYLDSIYALKDVKPDTNDIQKTDDAKAAAFLGRCSICGTTQNSYGALHKHIMRCYTKIEKRTDFCSPDPEPENPENIICDALCKPQNMFCKRLRLLCPDHYKGPLNEKGTLCAAPLYMYEEDFSFDFTTEIEDINLFFSKGYCKFKKEACDRHNNWAQIFLGSIDNFRISLLTRMEEAVETYRKCRRQYYRKFDICEIMQNYKITETTDKYGMPKDVDFVNDLPSYFNEKVDWSEEIKTIEDRIQKRLNEIFEETEKKKEAEKAKKEAQKKTRGKKKTVKRQKPAVKKPRKVKSNTNTVTRAPEETENRENTIKMEE